MYETEIKYAPITKNTILSVVVGESFEYEEEGVKSVLTPTSIAIIDSPNAQIYIK